MTRMLDEIRARNKRRLQGISRPGRDMGSDPFFIAWRDATRRGERGPQPETVRERSIFVFSFHPWLAPELTGWKPAEPYRPPVKPEPPPKTLSEDDKEVLFQTGKADPVWAAAMGSLFSGGRPA
jgi:hypothetical protein